MLRFLPYKTINICKQTIKLLTFYKCYILLVRIVNNIYICKKYGL